jgi:anti-sigma factor RsiW
MKVTRDVVMDLLPLYVAGEACADTRALVEEFLEQDADLRHRVREGALDALVPTANQPAGGRSAGIPGWTVPPDVELRSLRRTRGRLRWQRLTYAWALAVSLLSLTTVVSFKGDQVHIRVLLVDYPGVFAAVAGLALSLWAAYFLLRRHTRVTRA